MSLLSIVQDAAVLVGLSRPSAVASSTDQRYQELMLLASLACKEIAKWHDWSTLSTPAYFLGDGTTTTFNLPTDFDRFAFGQKIILDGGVGIIASGPLSPPEITSLRARSPVTVAYVFYRRGNQLITSPALGSGRKGIYEYQRNSWISSADGVTPRQRFELDTDIVTAFDEDLVMLGLVWKWKQMKGLDFANAYEDWRQQVELSAARDRGLVPVGSGPAMTQLPEPITPDMIIVH